MTFFEQKIRERAKLSSDEPVERFTIATLIEAVLAIDCDEDARAFYHIAWLATHLPEDAAYMPSRIASDGTQAKGEAMRVMFALMLTLCGCESGCERVNKENVQECHKACAPGTIKSVMYSRCECYPLGTSGTS